MSKPRKAVDYLTLKTNAPKTTCEHCALDLDCAECWRLNAYIYNVAGFDSWGDPRAWRNAWAIVKGIIPIPTLRQTVVNSASRAERCAIRNWIVEWKSARTVFCYWCREIFRPRDCHADHVIPLSRGGEHALSNLVIACANCNLRKHDLMPDEWAERVGARADG